MKRLFVALYPYMLVVSGLIAAYPIFRALDLPAYASFFGSFFITSLTILIVRIFEKS